MVYTMMLSIYGIFVNPYCDRKSHLYKCLFTSIKEQERNCKKKKTTRTINVKRGMRIGDVEKRAPEPEKRIKITDEWKIYILLQFIIAILIYHNWIPPLSSLVNFIIYW